MGGRKRQNLTLDLNSASPKKNKVQNLLTSPDVQMLKLTSPELEKISKSKSDPSHTNSRWLLPQVSDGGADDVRQGLRGGAGEDAPGEFRPRHGHPDCDGGQHAGDSQLWPAGPARCAPAAVSPP